MKNCLLLTLSVLALVAACSDYPNPVAQSQSPESLLQPAQRVRVCDQSITWRYKDPAQEVPDKYKSLIGLWTGEVDFAGGGSMCIVVAVSDVRASGDIDAIFAWNLGASSSAGDLLNTHSQGTANWWAKGIKAGPKNEEIVVFAAKDPYNGLMYEYHFSFPRNGKMVGAPISNKLDGSTKSVDAALLARQPYPAPLVADAKE